MMTFPDTWEEFEKLYGFNDVEEIYTNNSRLIPSFRVKQWIDHEAKQENKRQAIKASDSINREDAIANVALEIWHYPNELYTSLNCFDNCQELAERALNRLPSAQPERAIKDCRNCKHGNYNDHWDTYFCYHSDDCNDWDKWEPSAQPELVRCKDCRWGREACGNIECWVDTNIPPEYHGYEWFCPNGERKDNG